MSQDMILPVLPLFYANVLGLSKELIGLIEGLVNTTVSLTKIGAGLLSDRLQRRKELVFVGYALSAAARPLLALAASGGHTLVLRFVDGVGKGVKDAPRDALVAGSARADRLGWSFGLQRMLDTFGSVLGPLVTFALLRVWPANPDRYRFVFLGAGLVAGMTLLITGVAVRERRVITTAPPMLSLAVLHGPFSRFLALMLLFTLGNSSDTFLLLRAQNVGVSPTLIPVVYALFNLSYAALTLPAGHLSDHLGRRTVILVGWVIYALTYMGFARAAAPWQIWCLYAFYGLYYATTEGVAKAMVADLVPGELRGTAFGLYNTAIGVMALPASVTAGWLWHHYGPGAPFYFGAVVAALAAVLLASSTGIRSGSR
jgi:MFS family permease